MVLGWPGVGQCLIPEEAMVYDTRSDYQVLREPLTGDRLLKQSDISIVQRYAR